MAREREIPNEEDSFYSSTLLQQYFSTQLYKACYRNKLDEVMCLLAQGFPVNTVDEKGHTELNWACYHNNLEMVKLLLDNGAEESVNTVDHHLHHPLYWACYNKNSDMVTFLLEHGAAKSINELSVFGETLLQNLSKYESNIDIFKLLCQYYEEFLCR